MVVMCVDVFNHNILFGTFNMEAINIHLDDSNLCVFVIRTTLNLSNIYNTLFVYLYNMFPQTIEFCPNHILLS